VAPTAAGTLPKSAVRTPEPEKSLMVIWNSSAGFSIGPVRIPPETSAAWMTKEEAMPATAP
jgi:hypothetical protein